jgi:carboxylesterase
MPMDRRDFTTLLGGSLLASPLAACAPAATEPPPPVEAARPFAESVRAIRAAIARDAADPAILPAGVPRLYEHGAPVQHAVVLYHGFTNCPQQFDELARDYHARGCNVFVPRIPHHGLKDRLTRDLANVTVSELQGFAAETFGLARGLGTTVSVLGLSLGGALALWLAKTQPVDLAVPIAPLLLPLPDPQFIGAPALRLLRTIPSMYWWWDIRLKEHTLPVYAYPGYPTHALAELVYLGDAIRAASPAKPRARHCTIVLNELDNAVDNHVTRALLAAWNAQGAGYGELVLAAIPPKRHDVIDPTTFPAARTLVYPKLEALVLATSGGAG